MKKIVLPLAAFFLLSGCAGTGFFDTKAPPSPPAPKLATQAEMEAGTESASRTVSPLLVAQGIAALAGEGATEVADATVGAAGDGDTTHAYSKDDIRDYAAQHDSDFDGLPDGTEAGVVTAAMLAATLDISGKTVTFGLEDSDIPDTITASNYMPLSGGAFTGFPTTPAEAPDADYEVANKKYVDDNSGGVSTASPIGATAFTDLTGGGSYSNFGGAGDDTINELFAAVDTAIGGLSGGHDALTLGASLSSIFSLTDQELGLTAWPTFNQNTTGTAAGLTAQYVDWNSSSGGSSIANKPTIPTASSLSVDDLITLSGVAGGAQNLGTFTGSTIADNQTIKAAIQALETAIEAGGGTDDQTAAEVPFTPTGTIAATDTQVAIAEVANEAAQTSGFTMGAAGIPFIVNSRNITMEGSPTSARVINVGDFNMEIPAATAVDANGLIAVSSGISGLGSNVGTFLDTPSIGNFFTALTGEATGASTFLTTPTLANLGSLLTNEGAFATTLLGYANASAVRTGLSLVPGTNVQAYDADLMTWAGVTPGTGIATALAVNIGSAGAPMLYNGAGGTPSAMVATNVTGLPPATGIVADCPTYSTAQTLTWAANGRRTNLFTNSSTVEFTVWDCETANIGQSFGVWASDESLEGVPASGDHFVLFDGTALDANDEIDVPAGARVKFVCIADDTFAVHSETDTTTDGGVAD